MTPAPTEAPPNKTPPGATDVLKFHVSLNVSDLPRSLAFYTALLGEGPVKVYENYAKFELSEPPLVLSLKPHPARKGGPLNHLGLRVRTPEELQTVRQRLDAAGYRTARQEDVRCCYAHQTKFWVADPDDTLWEVYQLHADFALWGEGNKVALMLPSLRALGFFGSIRRALSKPFRLFRRKSGAAPSQAPVLPPDETVPQGHSGGQAANGSPR